MIARKLTSARRKRRRYKWIATLGIVSLVVATIPLTLSIYDYAKKSGEVYILEASVSDSPAGYDLTLSGTGTSHGISIGSVKSSWTVRNDTLLVAPGNVFETPTSPTSSSSSSSSAGSEQSTNPPSEEPPVSTTRTEQSTTSPSEEEVIREQCIVSPTTELSSSNHQNQNNNNNNNNNNKGGDSGSSCAILLFGLPRSFKLFVLPSIIENILVPNKDNNCDYYLHYFAVTSEGQNRAGEAGGTINGNDVFLLENVIRQVYENETFSNINTGNKNKSKNKNKNKKNHNSIPHLSITNSTIEEFEKARSKVMTLYETTLDKDNQYLYFPYEAASWEYPQTIRNMVKQWHSIDAVWQHMEESAKVLKKNYTRVAMLRNDVMYVTPIDIYKLSNNQRDVENTHVVIPDWANYPINDRMIAGPYDAVKIWATERFQRIESHVRNYPIPGWVCIRRDS